MNRQTGSGYMYQWSLANDYKGKQLELFPLSFSLPSLFSPFPPTFCLFAVWGLHLVYARACVCVLSRVTINALSIHVAFYVCSYLVYGYRHCCRVLQLADLLRRSDSKEDTASATVSRLQDLCRYGKKKETMVINNNNNYCVISLVFSINMFQCTL